jgi:hypothetical protein
VTGNDPLNRGQSYTVAAELRRIMQTGKYPKKLINILHVKTGTTVTDKIYRLHAAFHHSEFNNGPL